MMHASYAALAPMPVVLLPVHAVLFKFRKIIENVMNSNDMIQYEMFSMH